MNENEEVRTKWFMVVCVVFGFILGGTWAVFDFYKNEAGSWGISTKTDLEYKRGFNDAKQQGVADLQEYVKDNITCQYVMNGTQCDFKFVKCTAKYSIG